MEKFEIRLEKKSEQFDVESLTRESFWNVYRPGCLEHYVLHCLRDDPAFIPELNFVMEQEGRLIGQCICMRAELNVREGVAGTGAMAGAMAGTGVGEQSGTVPIMTLGPIGIHPDFKRKGYGKALLDYTLEKASHMGFGAVCFEGNIDFYGKSGFDYASSFGISYHGLPEGEDASFFLCKELIPGFLAQKRHKLASPSCGQFWAEYSTPQGYFVDESKAEEFDALFPPKEKLKLPGQLW